MYHHFNAAPALRYILMDSNLPDEQAQHFSVRLLAVGILSYPQVSKLGFAVLHRLKSCKQFYFFNTQTRIFCNLLDCQFSTFQHSKCGILLCFIFRFIF